MVPLRRFYERGVPGSRLLFFEGVLVTAFGLLASGYFFPEHATIVSLFLASIAADDSMQRVLEGNRRSIVEDGVPARVANLVLTVKILALFLGAVAAYTAFAATMPWSTVDQLFSLQTGPHHPLFPLMYFGTFRDLLAHNLGVMIFFFVVALPFRQGGVMLAIAWNASVWGGTVASLARHWSERGGPWFPWALLRVAAAIVPHLSLEGVAYVGAGMAGVFVSRAAEKYELGSDVMYEILESVLAMLAIMACFVIAGAAWEAMLARGLVRVLS